MSTAQFCQVKRSSKEPQADGDTQTASFLFHHVWLPEHYISTFSAD